LAASYLANAEQAKDTTLIIHATEIRMRAERRAGELLAEMKERGERETQGGNRGNQHREAKSQHATLPKLADLGVSKAQSSRWQQLAALDAASFESKVASASKRAYDLIAQRFIKEGNIARAKERHSKIIEHGCAIEDLVALAKSGKRFGVILADPAWPYATWSESGKHRSAENHYGTQSIDEIARLPVAALAADDCALLLWCTSPHIAIGSHVKVIEAWGFKASTIAFDWIKTNPGATVITLDGEGLHTGLGHSTRSNSEQCFLGIKGSPECLAKDVHQVVIAPVGEHSAKPEEVRRRIERLLPGPYLELYGRKQVEGWYVWGNEVVAPLKALPRAGNDDDLSIPPSLRRTAP
jgi:N6-adenosine-specific RNA methylase IME4